MRVLGFKRFVWVLFLFGPTLLRGDLFFIDGSMLILNANASFIETIEISHVEDNTTVLLYPFTSFTSATNKQLVSHYLPRVRPKPDSMKVYMDELGNRVIEFFFKRLLSKGVVIESEFVLDNELALFTPDNFYEYPLPSSMLKSVMVYLSKTRNTASSRAIDGQVARLIGEGDNQFHVVLKILNWVRRNIRLNLDIEDSGARSTFALGEGNYDGILNLSLCMLRVARIPCRFVHGFSINKTFKFVGREDFRGRKDFDNKKVLLAPFGQSDNFEITYPKSSYNWLEIYFPNLHWASFDIYSSYFFVPSNLIRRNISLDSVGGRGRAYSVSGGRGVRKDLSMLSKYFISFTRDRDKVKAFSYRESGEYFIFPMFFKGEHSFISSLFSLDDNVVRGARRVRGDRDEGLAFSFNPYSLEFDDSVKQIELRLTSMSPYTQSFFVDKGFNLEKVSLPLFRFNNHPLGRVWLEIRKAGNEKFILKSEERSVSGLDNSGFYSFIFFLFPSVPFLGKGSYTLSFKSSTEEIILWRGVFGNPYYRNKDTFYISNGTRTYVYLDLCFRMYKSSVSGFKSQKLKSGVKLPRVSN